MTTQQVAHTPGPWRVSHSELTVILPDCGPDVTALIGCECNRIHVEYELTPILPSDLREELSANARLIAAAPLLLEALKVIVDMPQSLDRGFTPEFAERIKDLAQAAISKAETR